MTELKTNITLEQLAERAEAIDKASLLCGDLLEVLRLRKDAELILHFAVGRSSEDRETQAGIDMVKTSALAIVDHINRMRIRGMAPIAGGSSLAESFDELLVRLAYLVDLLDPVMVLKVERALLAS